MIRHHHHIPIEIQTEIIKRNNDLKLLIRWRSVSKAWKSLIDSKEFIAAHTTFLISQPETQHHRLLVRYEDLYYYGYEYVSFVDDDRFRHDEKVTLFAPDLFYLFHHKFVGSSHGLFSFYDTETTNMAVIWNPSIRKSVAINLPNVLMKPYTTVVGFGVCPRTHDPKLVKINCIKFWTDLEYGNYGIPHQIEVFTFLCSGGWRSPLSSNLPHKSIRFGTSQAVIDGFIYWDACVRTNVDNKFKRWNLVMSFDLTSEEFQELHLPDILAHHADLELEFFKLRDSLAVIEFRHYTGFNPQYCAVWMMTGHGYSRSFKIAKLFNIASPNDTLVFRALGLTKSGAPILEIDAKINESSAKISVYEPCSQHKNDIGIFGIDGSFILKTYMETLLLIDQ